MHHEVVDKQSGEDKRENDGYCQEPLTDSDFGFCDVVHGGEMWMIKEQETSYENRLRKDGASKQRHNHTRPILGNLY